MTSTFTNLTLKSIYWLFLDKSEWTDDQKALCQDTKVEDNLKPIWLLRDPDSESQD